MSLMYTPYPVSNVKIFPQYRVFVLFQSHWWVMLQFTTRIEQMIKIRELQWQYLSSENGGRWNMNAKPRLWESEYLFNSIPSSLDLSHNPRLDAVGIEAVHRSRTEVPYQKFVLCICISSTWISWCIDVYCRIFWKRWWRVCGILYIWMSYSDLCCIVVARLRFLFHFLHH